MGIKLEQSNLAIFFGKSLGLFQRNGWFSGSRTKNSSGHYIHEMVRSKPAEQILKQKNIARTFTNQLTVCLFSGCLRLDL